MGKIIYSNLSATNLSYLVLDYLFNIKNFYDPGDLLILCFWDYDIYKFNRADGVFKNKSKIRGIIGEVSRLLNGLNLNHQIIYLSDCIKRLNAHEDIFELYLDCCNHTTTGGIEETYKENKHLNLRSTTLGKINFMIIDFLIALFFKELYPSLAKGKNIELYHTGQRFVGVRKEIEEAISRSELVVNFPAIKYWKTLPILNYNEGNWVSMSMSKGEMERIIKDNFPDDKNILKDLLEFGLRIDDSILNKKTDYLIKKIDTIKDKDIIAQEIAGIFISYFSFAKKILDSSPEGEIKKIDYIDSKEKFEKVLESINPSKLEILKYCNGKNSIDEIISMVSMRESSIRSYISRMKKEKLITETKKPQRLIEEIVISLK